jgi:hypothetical protein
VPKFRGLDHPPEWGEESHVLVEEEVQDVVRDLRNLGEEWKGISPDDLVRMDFVGEVAPGRAVYEVAGRSCQDVCVRVCVRGAYRS